MTVDFETMRTAGWSPLGCASLAESRGMSRLEAFKAVFTHWGAEPFAVSELERYGTGYPSRAAQAAATVGLAAIVLEYPTASCDDFAAFERVTRISVKVDALARADRADDALGFYDRLDPNSLRLTPITEAEARTLARSMRTQQLPQLSVVIEPVQQYEWGWVLSPRSGLGDRVVGPPPLEAGLRPIIVDRFTGVAIEIGTDEPTEACVGRYLATGWP